MCERQRFQVLLRSSNHVHGLQNVRLVIGFLALISVVACDSSTAPDSSLVGQYELRAIDGDTSLTKMNSDGFISDFYGLVILRDDGSYSYAVMTRACRVHECTPMEVKVFGGRWWATSSDVDLHETADGTMRHWRFSAPDLSGQEPKFFNGSRGLVFRKCGDAEFFGCALFPGT